MVQVSHLRTVSTLDKNGATMFSSHVKEAIKGDLASSW
jgi:hypothetical protein